MCKEAVSEAKASNLQRHLERHHKNDYLAIIHQKPLPSKASDQKTIDFKIVKPTRAMDNLVTFAATTTFPLHLAENKHFKVLV